MTTKSFLLQIIVSFSIISVINARICEIVYVNRNPDSIGSSSGENLNYGDSSEKIEENFGSSDQDYNHFRPQYIVQPQYFSGASDIDDHYSSKDNDISDNYNDYKPRRYSTMLPEIVTTTSKPKPRPSRSSEYIVVKPQVQQYTMWDLV